MKEYIYAVPYITAAIKGVIQFGIIEVISSGPIASYDMVLKAIQTIADSKPEVSEVVPLNFILLRVDEKAEVGC